MLKLNLSFFMKFSSKIKTLNIIIPRYMYMWPLCVWIECLEFFHDLMSSAVCLFDKNDALYIPVSNFKSCNYDVETFLGLN